MIKSTTLLVVAVLVLLLLGSATNKVEAINSYIQSSPLTDADNRTDIFADEFDTSSFRLDTRFVFAAIAIVQSNPSPFDPDEFKTRVINSLPSYWQTSAHRQKFSDNFILIEYCTWPAHKTPCGKLNAYDWDTFQTLVMHHPTCVDRRLSDFQMLPFYNRGPLANWTLVRFSFNGADSTDYFENWKLGGGTGGTTGGTLKSCELVKSSASNYVQYAFIVKAVQPLEMIVKARSIPLPTNIQTEVNRFKLLLKQNPENTEAMAAIVIVIIVLLISCCVIKYLGKKNQDQKAKFAAQQQNARNKNNSNNIVPPSTVSSAGGGVLQMNENPYNEGIEMSSSSSSSSKKPNASSAAHAAAGGGGGGGQRNMDEAMDELAAAASRALAKSRQQQQQQQNNQQKPQQQEGESEGGRKFAQEHELQQVPPQDENDATEIITNVGEQIKNAAANLFSSKQSAVSQNEHENEKNNNNNNEEGESGHVLAPPPSHEEEEEGRQEYQHQSQPQHQQQQGEQESSNNNEQQKKKDEDVFSYY